MKLLKKLVLFCAAFLVTSGVFVVEANAQGRRSGGAASKLGGGTSSLGFGFNYTSSDQIDINGAMDEANSTTAGGISTKNLTGTYELYANWIYRFSRSDYALVIRPSYLWQESTGTGSGGNFNYKINGFSLFPMLRIYPLENTFIKFFLQGGLGYGTLNGDIQTGAASVQFKGSAFGAIGGIGADFCFTETHCLTVEGNMRYLPIERNLSSGGNCTNTGGSNPIPGISQCGNSQEVERSGKDLGTTMSGVQGSVGYTVNF